MDKKIDSRRLKPEVIKVFADKGLAVADDAYLLKIIDTVKDRCVLLPDFYLQAGYFFEQPKSYDINSVKPKWTDAKSDFFHTLIAKINATSTIEAAELEAAFKASAEEKAIKVGELMLPFRIMLVGGKFGPHVFDIAALLGKNETVSRIEKALVEFTT